MIPIRNIDIPFAVAYFQKMYPKANSQQYQKQLESFHSTLEKQIEARADFDAFMAITVAQHK